VGVIPLLYPRG